MLLLLLFSPASAPASNTTTASLLAFALFPALPHGLALGPFPPAPGSTHAPVPPPVSAPASTPASVPASTHALTSPPALHLMWPQLLVPNSVLIVPLI